MTWLQASFYRKVRGKHEILKSVQKGEVYHFSSVEPPTSSLGRFPRPTSKAREKRPGDEFVEPRYNELLCNEVLGIRNEFPYPSKSKTCEKEPRYNETSFHLANKFCQSLGPLSYRGSTVVRFCFQRHGYQMCFLCNCSNKESNVTEL